MYYDQLKKRARAVAATRAATQTERISVESVIAPCYLPLHQDIAQGLHEVYHLPGGRGSCKSSFVSIEIVDGMMHDQTANAIIFRRVAGTMRESVFSQIQWAIDQLGASALWIANVSPMQFIYKPTGQQIVFRGLDDPSKLKSIKPRRGRFRYVWFEEFAELTGERMVRSVLQSVVRGGDDFCVFNSFNPPISLNNWANKYILQPNAKATIFRTDYRMIPPEWLGENFIAEAERLRSVNESAYRHEYLGEAVGSGGEVFPNIEIRTITDEEIQNNADYIHQGIDWGFSVDPVVLIRASYNHKHDTIMLLDEIYRKHCSNRDFAEAIKAKRYDLYSDGIFEDSGAIFADAAEPKSIVDLRNEGVFVRACKKYPGSVLYGIKWLQSRRIIIDPARTPNAYREFTGYEYETTKDGEFLADVPDRDNHTIDALRYAFDRLINRRGISA